MSDSMTNEGLDRLEALASACFVGPWRSTAPFEVEPADDEDEVDYETVCHVEAPEEYPRDEENPQVVAVTREDGTVQTPGLSRFAQPHADFIAAARTAVPLLVKALRKARAERDEARRERDKARDCGQDVVCAIAPGCQRHWAERARELLRERDEARANYAFVVERAANVQLDGYRELGARAAAAENERDEARAEVERLRARSNKP